MQTTIKLYHQYEIITLHTSTVKTLVIGILFEVSIAYVQPLLEIPWQFDIEDPLYLTAISYSCIYYQLHSLTDLDRNLASRSLLCVASLFPIPSWNCVWHDFSFSPSPFLCWSCSSLCLIKHGVGKFEKPSSPGQYPASNIRTLNSGLSPNCSTQTMNAHCPTTAEYHRRSPSQCIVFITTSKK